MEGIPADLNAAMDAIINKSRTLPISTKRKPNQQTAHPDEPSKKRAKTVTVGSSSSSSRKRKQATQSDDADIVAEKHPRIDAPEPTPSESELIASVPIWLRLSHNLSRQFELTGTEKTFLPLLLQELDLAITHATNIRKKKHAHLTWPWQFIDCATDCATMLKNLSYVGFCAWMMGTKSKFSFPYLQHSQVAHHLALLVLKRYPRDFEEWLIELAVNSDPTLKPINLQLKVEDIFADVLKQHAHAVQQGQLTLAMNLKKDSQCFKCGCSTVIEILAQLRSGDEGMNALYRCGNAKCGATWKR